MKPGSKITKKMKNLRKTNLNLNLLPQLTERAFSSKDSGYNSWPWHLTAL